MTVIGPTVQRTHTRDDKSNLIQVIIFLVVRGQDEHYQEAEHHSVYDIRHSLCRIQRQTRMSRACKTSSPTTGKNRHSMRAKLFVLEKDKGIVAKGS